MRLDPSFVLCEAGVSSFYQKRDKQFLKVRLLPVVLHSYIIFMNPKSLNNLEYQTVYKEN